MFEPLRWHESPFAPPDVAKIAQALPEAFAEASALWPDRVAIVHGGDQLTYEDLARHAAGLATQLRELNIASGPVALLQSAGPNAIAAWFATAMCGHAFLLLEPSHPALRLQKLIEASKTSAVVCDETAASLLPGELDLLRLVPDGRLSSDRLFSELGPDDPAMIFPTSGSTGEPKLVTYSARALQAKVQASMSLMRIPPAARVVIAGSHGNYGFVHHALVFLLSGGSICLIDIKTGGFRAVIHAIEELGARHARFTPSMFRAFARLPEARDALRSLEAVRFSGEALLASDLELARTVLAPDCLLQNIYGSTESSLFVWSSGEPVDNGAATVPIGRIYPGSSYALRPSTGFANQDAGELVIRSDRHALGDYECGAVRGDRFNHVPLKQGLRDYATGDIARRLPDGGLVLLGRCDRLVKVRGHRVFLAEVENQLLDLPGVTGAAVIDAGKNGEVELHGFVTLENDSALHRDVRAQLACRLPDHMVPRQFTILKEIPLLPGGKVNVDLLRDSVTEHRFCAVEARKDDGRQPTLCDLWMSLLGPGSEDPDNNFFTLGGDSLKLMELVVSVERQFSCKLPVEEFLSEPTLAKLSRLTGAPLPADSGFADRIPGKEGELRTRRVLPSRELFRGVALAMPGWRGSAPVFPFTQVGLFPDCDIWAADVTIRRDSILAEGQWWRSAIDIASRIRSGAIPRPRILFGYSVGGSIAWLVGRLLADTHQCPEYVLMVDAAPLHRLAKYQDPELKKAIPANDLKLPSVIHIHRASLAHVGIDSGQAANWPSQDNIQRSIGIPTVDHDDMLRQDVLKPAVLKVSQFLNGQRQAGGTSFVDLADATTLGMRVYQMLSSSDVRGHTEFDNFVAELQNSSGWELSPATLYLVLRDGTKDQANAIVETLISRRPASRLLWYAKYRLQRPPHALRPETKRTSLTQGFLSTGGIESALAAHQSSTAGRFSNPLMLFLQGWDVLRAALAARPYRKTEIAASLKKTPSPP